MGDGDVVEPQILRAQTVVDNGANGSINTIDDISQSIGINGEMTQNRATNKQIDVGDVSTSFNIDAPISEGPVSLDDLRRTHDLSPGLEAAKSQLEKEALWDQGQFTFEALPEKGTLFVDEIVLVDRLRLALTLLHNSRHITTSSELS
jgi:hypothetical protein